MHGQNHIKSFNYPALTNKSTGRRHTSLHFHLQQIQIRVTKLRGYVLRNGPLGELVVVRTCTYTNLVSIV